MKIISDYFNRQNFQLGTPRKQSPIKSGGAICNDTFEKTNSIAFTSGIYKDFEHKNPLLPELKVLDGVDKAFAERLTKHINDFPPKWLNLLSKKGYKVIAAPSLLDAYISEKVFDPFVLKTEIQNPKGTLGVTYDNGAKGKKFFVFCDKPPYSDDYLKNIVNHEFSHGIVNSLGLDKNKQVIEILKQDVDEIKKRKKFQDLSKEELKMVSYYFFNPKAHLPADEILADLLAWNNGGGCYGSGFIMGVKNPDIMKTLFPKLNSFLSQL